MLTKFHAEISCNHSLLFSLTCTCAMADGNKSCSFSISVSVRLETYLSLKTSGDHTDFDRCQSNSSWKQYHEFYSHMTHLFANIGNLTLNVILLSNIAAQFSPNIAETAKNNLVTDFQEFTAQGKRWRSRLYSFPFAVKVKSTESVFHQNDSQQASVFGKCFSCTQQAGWWFSKIIHIALSYLVHFSWTN